MSTLPGLQAPRSSAHAGGTRAHTVSFKPSRYNVFVERDEVVWAYNARSGAFSRLSVPEYGKAKRLLDGGQARDQEEETLFKGLVRGQFFVPAELDELDLLKVKNRLARFSGGGLGLIIAPTLRCNFSCPYCYVDRNANKMSPAARERVKRFFSRKLEKGTKASVCWTGGDPSLALDVVEELTGHFLRHCEEVGGDYEAVMISNGYLLEAEAVESLKRSHVKAVQVTFDGPREFHDSTRALAGGRPTFDRILDNVVAASREIIINLRINVDSRNWRSVPGVLDELASRGLGEGKTGVYFAHVQAINEQARDHEESCLSAQDYAELEPVLMQQAINRGFRLSNRSLQRQVHTFCGANCRHHFVIDPNARLQRCYDDLGHADTQGIGYINDEGEEVIDKYHNYLSWISWDPFEIEECRECKVLPLCMGGCSYHEIRQGLGVEPGCLKLRYNLEQVMTLYGEHLSGRNDRRGEVLSPGGCSACATL